MEPSLQNRYRCDGPAVLVDAKCVEKKGLGGVATLPCDSRRWVLALGKASSC